MRTLALAVCGGLLLAVTAALAEPLPVIERGLLPGDLAMGPAVNTQKEHSIAKGGDQYLVAWTDLRAQAVGGGANQSGSDVFGIRVDAQGNPIEAMPFQIAGGMGVQQRPLVAWNGQAWLVVFISQDQVGGYYEDRMRAVRVSAQGQALDTTPIEFPPTQYTPNTIGLQVAGQNGQWLVTRCIYHDDGYGTKLVGQRLDGNGTLLDTTPRLLLDWIYGGTKLLAADGEYLVAGPEWNYQWNSKARRVGLDAQPIGASFDLPSLILATNGSEYYVSWIADYVNLVGSRMTLSGTLLTPAGTMIVPNFSQYDQSTLAHDGTQWWFEWGVSDHLHTVRIDAGGNVLDPGGGVLLPIQIGGNVSSAYNPVLIPRVGGGVDLYWYDLRIALGNDANVFALPISAANVPGTERCVSTGTRSQRTPDFAAGPGGQVAVTFISETANDDRVLVHLLGPTGLPLTTEPMEVAAAPSIGKSGIAWNGSVYLVTWDEGALGIRARRMNGDGTFVDAAPIDVMPGFNVDVAALDQNFCVIASNFQTYPQYIAVYYRRLDGITGGLLDGSPVLVGQSYAYNARIHTDGARWIATWERHPTHDDPQSSVQYSFISADGSHTQEASVNSPFTSPGGQPDVAMSGSHRLFVWRSNSLANANNYIRGRLMNADGSWATDLYTIAEAPGRQLRPVVGWDGTSFVVAWDDQRNQGAFFDERTDIYGARVSETGTVLDPSGFPIYVGPQGDATAAILSRSDGVSFVASARFQTASPFDTYRIGVTVLGLEGTVAVPASDALGMPRVSLRQNLPNPFNSQTTIDYVLAGPGSIRLSIYDVNGRAVRTLVRDVIVSAGRHAVAWDGRGDDGRELPGGVYFSRLDAGGQSARGRMTLVR